jgi:hypothetical protein
MAGERILYVCFDPTFLAQRERSLLRQGYEVYTVLGLDGLMSTERVDDYDFILIGDEGTVKDRENSVRRLKQESPMVPVIALNRNREHLAGANYQVSVMDMNSWFDAVADSIQQYRNLA